MRSVRLRILASLLVLAIAAIGGWQLLPAQRDEGRTITVGTTDPVTSLDPAGAYDTGSWALFSNVFQSLLTFEPGGATPVPDAARSCEFAGNALTVYRCTLRPGLTFPSGREVTGKDVKYSFDRVKRIDADTGPAALFDTLQSVTADGLSVDFRLSSPDATFPFKVATGAGAIVDRTKYPVNGLRTDGGADGSGPYTLASYTAGQARLTPNSGYRGAVRNLGNPVLMRYYKDSAALRKAWQARRIDVVTRTLPPATLAALSPSDPDQRVTEVDSTETRNLVLNVRVNSPFQDRRVRQALAALINREKLVADVYRGTTDPLYSLIPAGITGHTTSFFDANPKPDPQRARRLLDEAGVSMPVRFTYGYAEGRGSSAAEAAELKEQLEASGLFYVTTKAYEWTAFQQRYAEGKLDAYGVGWVADYPDPDTFGGPLVGTGGPLNNAYGNAQADRLIRDSRRYEDRGRAVADFKELQDLVAQDVPMIPLWQRKDYVLSSEDVGGAQYLSDGTGVFRLWRLEWI
ncbi:ABC transporter substrate-binding protein [Streptomyces griseiscabiei]|uniref:ABC transporter substrate-binding protein n=1 Tax=Streptomyces griseiscabiei TaxID=2993540 RepID=A0ABU4LDW5_9ACTN|nr:ABC transporter substrate-binding protein [Streptomyces griseiscabiei]MBZ3907529.1 peptide-binding protein [Streptomyces griseiscabiei]MDX2913621.1 ABC transporter substrate-binding protein [Streptomyces griseiscabiei]